MSLFHTCLATCIIFVCVSQTLHSVSLRSFYLLSSVFMFLLPYIYKSLNFITHIIFITLNASRGSLSVIFYPNISAYLLFFLHNTCQYLKILFKILILMFNIFTKHKEEIVLIKTIKKLWNQHEEIMQEWVSLKNKTEILRNAKINSLKLET